MTTSYKNFNIEDNGGNNYAFIEMNGNLLGS